MCADLTPLYAEEPGASCEGVAYRVAANLAAATFAGLDHREKNGYQRHDVQLEFRQGGTDAGVAYIAPVNNPAFLGPAPVDEIVAQIRRSAGPSGTNIDYLHQLETALRRLRIEDAHVFELARRLRASEDQARANRANSSSMNAMRSLPQKSSSPM